MGVKQPDLSNILRGHFRGYSVERLKFGSNDQNLNETLNQRQTLDGFNRLKYPANFHLPAR